MTPEERRSAHDGIPPKCNFDQIPAACLPEIAFQLSLLAFPDRGSSARRLQGVEGGTSSRADSATTRR